MKLKVDYRCALSITFEQEFDAPEEEMEAIIDDYESDVDNLIHDMIANNLDGDNLKVAVKRKKLKIDEV